MSWGERSCAIPKKLRQVLGDDYRGCPIASPGTCNVNCPEYQWDGKTEPDSKPLHEADYKIMPSKRQERCEPVRRQTPKVGRNDSCPCGSLKKYKKCCERNTK
jgi:hypothetical protein